MSRSAHFGGGWVESGSCLNIRSLSCIMAKAVGEPLAGFAHGLAA